MYDGATGGVNHYTRTELRRVIQSENSKQTLHIVDSREPIFSSPCKIVFVCSPRLEHESQLVKKNLESFYMPRWNLNELEECRCAFYNDLPQDLVKELFRRWNGVPRFVLQKAQNSWSKYSLIYWSRTQPPLIWPQGLFRLQCIFYLFQNNEKTLREG